MTPAAIIKNALADGVKLTLSHDGTIKAAGKCNTVNRWVRTIREHKTGIIAALEAYEERAAIMEYDGGLDRESAERCARAIVFCEDCQYHMPQPDSPSQSGSVHATPSGCKLGVIAPNSWPPIYSFTGWCCAHYLKTNSVSAINSDVT